MIRARHAEIIDKLGEFYTLMAQLCAVSQKAVRIPTLDSPAPINRQAALAAGFTQESVDLMEQLPYIETVGPDDTDPEIMPSTEALAYSACKDEMCFESYRAMDDELDNDGNLVPGSVLKLTTQNVYGTTLLYDTETCLLIEWKSFDNPEDVMGYAHIPARPPPAVLEPWIQAFRTFRYMLVGGISLFSNKERPCENRRSHPRIIRP